MKDPKLDEEDEDLLKRLLLQSLQSKDIAEEKMAFSEKRKPLFRGR